MNNLPTMQFYINGMGYMAIAGIIIYPFFSYLIGKMSLNKWFDRISSILILLGGWYLFYNPFHNQTSNVFTGALFVSFIVYHLITDRLQKRKKAGSALIEMTLTTGLLFGTLYAVAWVADLPVGKQIIEKLADGSFTFFPGNFEEMLTASAGFSILLIASKYLHNYLFEQAEKKRQKKIKETILQKELVQAQLDALHAKINPHFLYNSLNTIAGLALVDGEKTRQMALALSRFFRYSINKEQTNLVRVTEETEMIKTYLDIERIRFGEQLAYTIDTQKECEDQLIPRMLLQPLIENCVKHGRNGEQNSILIQIRIKKEEDKLILSIKDNGAPFPVEFIPGYGLKSTYDKLDLLFPKCHEIEIIPQPEKEIRITIKATSQPIS